MGTISRQTTWSTGDTLTASDINGEFDNILSTANGSLNADNLGVTAGQAAASKAIVLDSNKDFADTSSSNQIRNLTISGSLKIGTTFLPDASGGADLGSTALEWGDVYIADDKKIYLGSDQDISLQYDETTNNALEIAAAVEGAALGIVLKSDQGDDAGDEWKLNIADGGTLTLGNDIASAGTYVTHLTLTPNSTVSSSTLALAGALTVAGTASITGVATVGGITIGSAVINEAELETIDGITAGTVAASKAVVVDSNKDAASFRNITLTGELDAATLDISGNADIDGTTNLDAVDIDGAVQIDATVTVGADDQGYDVQFFGDTASAYLLWDTSADKLLTAGGAVIDIVKDKLLIGGTAVTTTAAELNVLDAVTAGTVAASKGVVVDANKDIASFRNVTLTGELDAATLDISGNADIDGTTNLDAVDIDGAVQVDATITVGADDQGYDIIFYGDTASANLTWDTSADDLILNGGAGLIVPDGQLTLGSTALAATAAELNVLDGVTAGTVAASKGVVVDANKDIGSFRNVTLTGELDAATLDISGNADIDGTTNLDAVDIDGAVQVDATVTVGVDDTGYDVKFFGATSGSSMLWDESADDLILTNAGLAVGSDATGDIYYRDANGFLARLAIGSDGQVLTSTGTVVNWEAAGGGGGGDFSGPGSATDNAVVRFNGTGGKTGQNSGVTIDDSNNATGFANLTLTGELQTANIGYTDGDNAITIADGGGCTFPAAAAFSGDVSMDGGSFVFNESGANKDFRIEGDSDQNLFFADASTDRIGIGTGSPAANLHVETDKVSSDYIGYFHNTRTSDGGVQYGVKIEAGFDTHDDVFKVCNGNDQKLLQVRGNGNIEAGLNGGWVGIGAAPTANLHVETSKTTGDYIGYFHNSRTSDGGEQYGVKIEAGFDLYDAVFHVANGSNTKMFQIDGAGTTEACANGANFFIADTANANMTQGITIQQGSASNQVLAFKHSGSVAHGMTDLYETDTYGMIGRSATDGGMSLECLSGSSALCFSVTSNAGAENTASSTSAISASQFTSEKKNGTTRQAIGADGNLFGVRNGGNTRLVLKGDGDLHYDGSTNATSWDDHDDVGLLNTFRNLTTANKAQDVFGQFIGENAQILHDTGVITMNDDGHHFVSTKGLNALIIDTIRQEGQKWRKVVGEYHDKIAALEQRLLRLEA